MFSARVPHYLFQLNHQGQTSWVLGTLHDNIPLHQLEGVTEALRASKNVFVEIEEFKDRNRDEFLKEVNRRGFLEIRSESVEPRLGPRSAKKVKAFLENLPPAQSEQANQILHHAPIGAAYNYLMYLVISEKSPYEVPPDATFKATEPKDILDMQIVSEARTFGKSVYALDTVARNLDFYLSSATRVDLNKLISIGLHDNGETNLEIARHADMTVSDRVMKLMWISEYLNGTIDFSPDPFGALDLIAQRDETWKMRLLKSMRHNPTFTAVGVEHVMREGGLLDFFRQEGVEVTRIRESPGALPKSCRLGAIPHKSQ